MTPSTPTQLEDKLFKNKIYEILYDLSEKQWHLGYDDIEKGFQDNLAEAKEALLSLINQVTTEARMETIKEVLNTVEDEPVEAKIYDADTEYAPWLPAVRNQVRKEIRLALTTKLDKDKE